MSKTGQRIIPFKELIQEWNVPVLFENDVHIWFCDLIFTDKFKASYVCCLSDDEIAESKFFIGNELQRRYIKSHSVLKLLLSAYSGVDPKEITLIKNILGKPFWKEGGIYFNLTHSGNKFGIAFSRKHELGLDMEEIRQLHDFEEMIPRNFTKEEQQFIDYKMAGFEERFFQLWTIKESYLKATGLGMRLDPRMLDFKISNDEIILKSVDNNNCFDPWKFKNLLVADKYRATIAYHPDQELIEPFSIN